MTLRDLYVESAFYRLEALRDAIEATLLGGGGGASSRPGDTLVAAAGAIGRASALRGVISAAEAAAAAAPPPRKPTASAQTSPPERPKYRGGLSTAAYVGGEWRQLYEVPLFWYVTSWATEEPSPSWSPTYTRQRPWLVEAERIEGWTSLLQAWLLLKPRSAAQGEEGGGG